MRSNRNFTISTLGGHSALEVCMGAKKLGFKTLVIAAIGREKTYTKYYRNLIDSVVTVGKFADIFEKEVIATLIKRNCVFIPHRYLQVYCDLNKLENIFPVPIFGNKYLLKYEEREGEFTQYELLQRGDIPYPKRFSDPKDIDRLAVVKVKEAVRSYERAFFFARNFSEYKRKSQELIQMKRIKLTDLARAVIEEYLIGAQVNFNFFYSPLTGKLELLGTDTRRQTNIEGFIRLPASEQKEIEEDIKPTYIETGHMAVTVKESLLEKAFELGEKLIRASKQIVAPGIIGPFALQTAVVPGPPAERIIVYDISLRMPGSPGTAFTPYSQYLFGRSVSFGERIAMEIEAAILKKKFGIITT